MEVLAISLKALNVSDAVLLLKSMLSTSNHLPTETATVRPPSLSPSPPTLFPSPPPLTPPPFPFVLCCLAHTRYRMGLRGGLVVDDVIEFIFSIHPPRHAFQVSPQSHHQARVKTKPVRSTCSTGGVH